MAKGVKQIIKQSRVLSLLTVPAYRKIKQICKIPKDIALYKETKRALAAQRTKNRVFYIGIPAHNNLGDLAQGVCIRKWLKKHFADREIIEIETNALVNTSCSALKELKRAFSQEDIIVFQSGYTTTDLGGYADDMHCAVMQLLPEAKMLMMPQTIFFEKEERKNRTSSVYNSTKNMLFLARDRVSFGMAEEMFPDLPVRLYPDIVTTLIGQFDFSNQRDGILMCVRDDSEKYYSDAEIQALMEQCSAFANVEKTDTTKKVKTEQIVKNAEQYIMSEIERYSKYKVIITDRYHGTIFSLVAGTPVIIIKTTDHKVITGAEWFRGIYDGHVHLAASLEEALVMARELYENNPAGKLEPYFEEQYYDKLPALFQEVNAQR